LSAAAAMPAAAAPANTTEAADAANHFRMSSSLVQSHLATIRLNA
jgi:hypothetical protein